MAEPIKSPTRRFPYDFPTAKTVSEEQRQELLKKYAADALELKQKWKAEFEQYMQKVRFDIALKKEYGWDERSGTEMPEELRAKLSGITFSTAAYGITDCNDNRSSLITEGTILNLKITSLCRTRREVYDGFKQKVSSPNLFLPHYFRLRSPDWADKCFNRWDIPMGLSTFGGQFNYSFMDPDAENGPTEYLLPLQHMSAIVEDRYFDINFTKYIVHYAESHFG